MDSIRKINFSDFTTISKLERDVFKDCWSKKIIEDQINHVNAINLLLIEKNQVLGYIFAQNYTDFVEIQRIGVSKKARRKRIGETLIKEIEIIAAQLNINKILLEVRKDNLPAIKLYQKLQFGIDSIRKKYYALDNEDAILMSKELT
jgi:ribosomal-protein-alanine acetyltransferase|tara:strand:- start:2646 stop:3086 length:441 start_codon:yes stop_codon:yes gene_type:complete